MASTKTAPAAKSLIMPAFLFLFGDTKLTSSSIAVLKISAESTSPITIMINNHSIMLIFRAKPKAIAIIVRIICMMKLC